VLLAHLPQEGRRQHTPRPLRPALEPLLQTIASMTARIEEYDRQLESVADEIYPETKLLRQVHGVGTLTALAFVLTLEDPGRFQRSRSVGAYFGLSCRARTNRANAILRSASRSGATGS
jgi:transposase